MELILALIVVILFVVVSLSVSNKEKEGHKHTRPQKQKHSHKSTRDSYSKKPTTQVSHTKKAHTESEVKERIEDFPEVKVEYVIDGDTVVIIKNWQKIKVRLDSIDCPEDGQHWGDIATYGLIKLIGKRKVRIEEHGVDPYGRTLATLYVQHGDGSEWMNVNERMVTLGHAWVMRRFYNHLPKDRQTKLNRLERWSKTKKVGLWRTPDPIPPWKWRNAAA